MKFLTTEEWEKKFNKEFFDPKKRSPLEKIFSNVLKRMQEIIANRFNHSTFGIAMTLFHYYICFNDIRTIDINEISYACLYMTFKIQFRNMSYISLKNECKKETKNGEPDLIKYEIRLYSQLGYDLDIETPFQFFDNLIPNAIAKFPQLQNKIPNLRKFCFNLISDTYSRPLSIYYHPKIIYLSCLILSLSFLEYDFDLNVLLQGENVDLVAECMDKITQIYDSYIDDKNTK